MDRTDSFLRRLGRPLLALWLAGCLPLWGLEAPRDEDLYVRRICFAPEASEAVRSLAQLLGSECGEMTGVAFAVLPYGVSGEGIYLLRRTDDLTSRYAALAPLQDRLAELAGMDSEAFFIYSTGRSSLYLVGNSDGALRLGVYDYLRALGWRALLPGDGWRIRPARSSVLQTVNALRAPACRQRGFFGTGGQGPVLPLDPSGAVVNARARWRSENLFDGSVAIGGHAGEAFNTMYAGILQSNESMRAYDVYPTSRVPWSIIMKPCASDPGLQALYAADRATAWSSNAFAVSVEPADGGGYCVCPDCARYDEESSQVFTLARHAADALGAQHPGALVSLYAYAGHLAVPRDPAITNWLAQSNANVFVNVIPYGFNYTDLSGDSMAAAWAAAKPGNRGIYDYWSIPDWAQELPSANLSALAGRLQYLKSLNYDGVSAESTYGAGPAGLLLYMAGRMLFDAAADPAALRDEFCRLAFGPAETPMRLMLERWGSGFVLTDQEVGQSFLDVAEALELAAADPACLARVRDYAKYVQYIRLWLEYQRQPGDSEARTAAAEAALRHMWRIYDTHMVHAYRMTQLILNTYETGTNSARLDAEWDVADSAAAGWAWVRANPLTDAELAGLVASGVERYATPPNRTMLECPTYSTNLVPLNPDYVLDGQITATAAGVYRGVFDFIFHVRAGVTNLTFSFTPGTYYPANVNTVDVFDPAGAVVYSRTFGGNGVYGSNGVAVTLAVPTALPGNYRMTVGDRNQKGFTLSAERKLPFVLTPRLHACFWTTQKAWFYVPAGLSAVGLYAPGALPIVVKNESGATVAPSYGNGQLESHYPVTNSAGAKLWTLEHYTSSFGAFSLNTPQTWAFSPDGMMIPSNAPPRVSAGSDGAAYAPSNSVRLKGTVVDDRLSPAPFWTCAWARVAGPGSATFTPAGVPDPTVTFSAPGVYTLRLTATDSGGLAASDDVTVTCSAAPPNAPPVVVASTNLYAMLPAAVVALTAAVSDDGRPGPLEYLWTAVSGSNPVAIANAHARDTTASFRFPGEYRLRLAVSDGPYTVYDDLTVTVDSPSALAEGDEGAVGLWRTWNYHAIGHTLNSLDDAMSARFSAYEPLTVDRALQRYIGVDAGTLLRVGIQADDGTGQPSGTYLASALFDPPNGDSLAWFTFGDAALEAGRVYHLVTRPEALGGGESFMVYCSGSAYDTRLYDGARDSMLNVMRKSNGGAWTALANDPYFILGSAILTNGVGGPGVAQVGTDYEATCYGGAAPAHGQRFVIADRELPAGACIVVTQGTFRATVSGAFTNDLVLSILDDRLRELGRVTMPQADASGAECSYAFEPPLALHQGRTYYVAPSFAGARPAGSTTGFRLLCFIPFAGAGPAYGPATWGGTDVCALVQSAASGVWTSAVPDAGRLQRDLFFKLSGPVRLPVAVRPVYTRGQTAAVGLWKTWNFNSVGHTLNSLDDLYSARFSVYDDLVVDRALQRYIGVDAGTRLRVGLQADDGAGRPSGTYLASAVLEPPDGDSQSWFTFGAVLLTAGAAYHLVTQPEALGQGESFMIYCSSGAHDTRLYDGARDPMMNVVRKSNGGAWAALANDPYFILGNAAHANGAGGPGQPYGGAIFYLDTLGGSTASSGMRFTVSDREIPAGAWVLATQAVLRASKTAGCTNDLVLRVLDDRQAERGRIVMPNAEADGVDHAYGFAAPFALYQGRPYVIAPEFSGTRPSSPTVGFRLPACYPFSGGSVALGEASWGGTNDCVPVQSGVGGSWATHTVSGARQFDMVFKLQGIVLGGRSDGAVLLLR